jgi:argininosuccinate lyase
VGKGVPFRQAHGIVGRMVRYCIDGGKSLEQLTQEELAGFSPLIGADFHENVSLRACVRRRSLIGGTAPERVREHVAQIRIEIKDW